MNYLTRFNLSFDDIKEIENYFNKDIREKFIFMEDTVVEILSYLNSIGIKNIKDLIMNRPDICFMKLNNLKEKIDKFDVNLIKYIIENDINSLMNFEI